MSCDAVAAAAYLFLASTGPSAPQPMLQLAVAAVPPSVAHEPLFADIVGRAGKLKAEIQAYRTSGLAGAPAAEALAHWDAVKTEIDQLAALDMQGHVELAKRGTDGDLKCILKGISQDLPVKLKAIEEAKTGKAQDAALNEMAYLLRDNVEVITSPPRPTV